MSDRKLTAVAACREIADETYAITTRNGTVTPDQRSHYYDFRRDIEPKTGFPTDKFEWRNFIIKTLPKLEEEHPKWEISPNRFGRSCGRSRRSPGMRP